MEVIDMECSQCDAQPGDECTGPGEGYHLSRFDRFADTIVLSSTPVNPDGGDE